MKRWIVIALVLAGSGMVHAQSVDSGRSRYRGGEWTNSAAVPQRTDRFIDKDGDGICDGRASGLGLRRAGQGMNVNDAGTGSTTAGQGRGKKLQKGKK